MINIVEFIIQYSQLVYLLLLRKVDLQRGWAYIAIRMVTLCAGVKSYIYITLLYIFPSRTIEYATNTYKKYFTLLLQRINCYLIAYFDEKNPF